MTTTENTKNISLIERIAAGIIDIIFYIAVFSFISFIFTGQTDNLPNSVAWIPICLYVLVFHGYLNWTPGMKIFGFKFIDSDSFGKPVYWRPVLRWLIAFILRTSAIFGLIALFTFKSETGFYWDRLFRIKVARTRGGAK